MNDRQLSFALGTRNLLGQFGTPTAPRSVTNCNCNARPTSNDQGQDEELEVALNAAAEVNDYRDSLPASLKKIFDERAGFGEFDEFENFDGSEPLLPPKTIDDLMNQTDRYPSKDGNLRPIPNGPIFRGNPADGTIQDPSPAALFSDASLQSDSGRGSTPANSFQRNQAGEFGIVTNGISDDGSDPLIPLSLDYHALAAMTDRERKLRGIDR